MFENIQPATIIVSYVAVLFALCVHEAAHAGAAYLLDDDTAARMGRLTLNPLAHMDLLGTLVLPLLGMVTGARVIGWAKPVPVDPNRLTRKFRARVGYAFVAAAGPMSNLAQSFLFLLALVLLIRWVAPGSLNDRLTLFYGSMEVPVEAFLKVPTLSTGVTLGITLLGRLVIINVGLAIFNLLPFGPLDGAGILRGFIPYRWVPTFDRIQPTLGLIILVLFLVGVMGWILAPFYFVTLNLYVYPLGRLLLGA